MKGFVCVGLLLALVQVQCQSLHVFSEKYFYQAPTTAGLPIGVFNIVVEGETSGSLPEVNIVGGPFFAFGMQSIGTSTRRYTFSVAPSSGGTTGLATGTTYDLAISAKFPESSRFSAAHNISVAGPLEILNIEKRVEGTSALFQVVFNRGVLSAGFDPTPISNSVVNANTPEVAAVAHPQTDILMESVWHLQFTDVKPGDTICLDTSHLNGAPVVVDPFGYTLNQQQFQAIDPCITVDNNPCIGSFGPWSTCRYDCNPAQADESFNTQSRVFQFAGEECTEAPSVETRPCEAGSFATDCQINIFPGESLTECSNCATLPAVGSPGQTTASGCVCGGNCVADGNCCQSFFANCVADAASNPDYFYSYASCWTPPSCSTNACAETAISETDNSGDCSGRPYSHGCYCGINTDPVTGLFADNCGSLFGSDQCCGGLTDYLAKCT